MRKTLERRQKPTRQHYGTDETNAETARQYFQVTLNILEARKLSWPNPHSTNSYVIAVIGKKKHRTTVRKNMQEPCYREYFVFELYESIRQVQEQNIWLAVMEPRCCAPPRMIGEANIDLGAVWRQPHHQVFHKWAQLSLPRVPAAGVVGFLNVDITIIFRGDIHNMMPALMNEFNVEDNLLLPSGSEQQRANYIITVHGAFGVPRGNTNGDRRGGKLPNTFAKITFCGLTAKTAVQSRNCNPVYSEQISMVEMFPNMSHVIRFDVCSGDGCINRIQGTAQLNLEQISHDGENGFLPTFGPSLLHMYGAINNQGGDDGPCHRGSLLVSLKTEVPYYQQAIRTTSVEPVAPINIDNLWTWEDFCIFCPILEVSMLDRCVAGKLCGAAITIGEIPGDEIEDEEFFAMVQEIRSRKLHYTGSIDVLKTRLACGYLDFTNAFPVLQQAVRLPDFRFRMYGNNMVYNISTNLESVLGEVERRLKMTDSSTPDEVFEILDKAMDDTAVKLVKFLNLIPCSSFTSGDVNRFCTELDQKQIAMQKGEIEKIYRQITNKSKYESNDNLRYLNDTTNGRTRNRKSIKILISRAKSLVLDLKNIVFKTSDGSPDIVVWLLNAGSRVAYTRIPVSDIIYSLTPEQCGKFCGRIQTVYMKPLKCSKHANTVADCYCVAGKIELLLWMGLYSELSAFETSLPAGYKIKVKDNEMCLKATTVMLECRLFVYGAKFMSMESSNFIHTFVRINVMNAVKETQIKLKSLAPVWNQMLKIYKMMFTSPDRVACHPFTATVEVFDSDLSGNVDLVGRLDIQPVLDDRQAYEYAPELQWHDINRGAERIGQLLISAQLLQIPETLVRSTIYGSVEESFCASGVKDMHQDSDHVETLPNNLVPQPTTYKIDVYWWGLREVNVTRKPCVILDIDELSIKSDIIFNKKSNANFPNGRSSHKFEAMLSENFRPSLTIKLCDNSTFGRTMFLGTNVVKNPYKYLVKWLPENQRESSLKSMSIMSSNYYQVTPMLYVKNSRTSMKDSIQSVNTNLKNNSINVSNWKKFFCSKEPEEEECALLPMFSRDRQQTKDSSDLVLQNGHQKDWWMRFYFSQKENNENESPINSDAITIYGSELEAQPEFSKFKDWCSTLKLYNGKKTGIPERDEQLRCGYLKAGIVIYKWPPDSKTVAVSSQGVDLDKGYFSEYPNNDPTRHLVRVYVIRGLNILAREFTGKSNPYVVIGCGTKRIGDRNSYVSNNVNPVFGKMYEFRCTLPEDYMLTISLYDHDTIALDELIGSTSIDLEDRIYTKHRAHIGISKEYNISGPAKWRDYMKPSDILEEMCLKNHIPPPVCPKVNTIFFNGVEYSESERTAKSYTSPSERRQSIYLGLLHKWHTLPVCGYQLVPEHVETRSLFNPERPGAEQGKIQLWVDIYPLNGTYIPLPVDITLRRAEDYELRVVVWKVRGLMREWYGKGSADIYVKAWVGNVEQAQYTDVHYRSDFGEAAFNWRMIFNFQYQHNEIKLLRREAMESSEYEESVPPILIVQVLDREAMSKEDFIGTLTLDLNSMPRGVNVSNGCITNKAEMSDKINLFLTKSIRSWWPLTITDRDTGLRVAVGIIEMELTLLPVETAILMPVGTGRDPPVPLPEPWRSTRKNMVRPMLTWESVFRHGSIEYLIVGAIIIISLTAALWYFEMPRQFYNFFFIVAFILFSFIWCSPGGCQCPLSCTIHFTQLQR